MPGAGRCVVHRPARVFGTGGHRCPGPWPPRAAGCPLPERTSRTSSSPRSSRWWRSASPPLLTKAVLAAGKGTKNMQEISGAVQEGASAYLLRQFRTLAIFVVIAVVLLFLLPVHDTDGSETGGEDRPVALLRRRRRCSARSSAAPACGWRPAPTCGWPPPPGRRRRPRGGHEDRLPHRWRGRLPHRRPRPVRRRAGRPDLQGRRPDRAGGLRLRRRAAGHVHAGRRRHLHQGRRRRRRPGRQGRAGHPRGRPAQRRHHRRQRGRQRRRLRRHGRRPVRVVRGDAGRRADPGPGRVRRGRPGLPADHLHHRRADRDRRRLHHPAAHRPTATA